MKNALVVIAFALGTLFSSQSMAQTSVEIHNFSPCAVTVDVLWGSCGGGEGCNMTPNFGTYNVPAFTVMTFPPPCPDANPGYFNVTDASGAATGWTLFNEMFSCTNYSYFPDGSVPVGGCAAVVNWSSPFGMGNLLLEVL